MDYSVQLVINNNPYLKRFLKEHSYYYKDLIRDKNNLARIIEMMKKEYKMTLPDKLDKIKDNISLVNTFMDVLN